MAFGVVKNNNMMLMMKLDKTWQVLGLMILMTALASCRGDLSQQLSSPSLQKGSIDLTAWDFSEQGRLDLNGQWAMYWRQFVAPQILTSEQITSAELYMDLPHKWNSNTIDGKQLPGHGFATYAASVKVPPNKGHYGLKLQAVATSYQLWVNGQLITEVGAVADTAEQASPRFFPQVLELPEANGEYQIVFHVANFVQRNGGIFYSVEFGTLDALRDERIRNISFDVFLFGSLLITALYHLALFFLRPSEKSVLYFGLLCLGIAARGMLTGEQYVMHVFPGTDFFLLNKVAYISHYVCIPLFVLYMTSVFPLDFSSRLCRLSVWLGGGFSIVAIVFELNVYSQLNVYYQVITLITCFYVVYCMAKVAKNRRRHALVAILGLLVLILSTGNDLLNSNEFILTGHYVPFGVFVFVFSQSFMLSVRFSGALAMVENLSTTLQEKVEDRTAQLQSTLQSLESKHQELQNAQGQLVQAEKMVSIGTLVSGVAHEVNNPINFVSLSAHNLRSDIDKHKHFLQDLLEDEPQILQIINGHFGGFEEKLREIDDGSERVKTIVTDLRALSRTDEGTKISIRPTIGIDSTLRLIRTKFKNDVKFVSNFVADLELECWPTKLNQVFMNILVNGCQAIVQDQTKDGPGRIEITTTTQMNWFIIRFVDNGCGMDEQTRLQMFDPFFSTKTVGDGTGMGMAISYGIIEQHGGSIEVESTPRVGTIISIRLPLAQQSLSAIAKLAP